VSEQWIGDLVVRPGFASSPNLSYLQAQIPIPNIFYTNVTLGYTVEKTNTHIQAGIQNLTDKQPPLFYFPNIINSNTDVSTYNLVGRQFFISIVQKF
jgi:outer membrane receptor protein involved in Fe transport